MQKQFENQSTLNLQVHKELKKIILKGDPTFTNGRGDEGGWAPRFNNEEALDISVKAIENLGFTLGKEVGLGVDFASSTQWNERKEKNMFMNVQVLKMILANKLNLHQKS